MEITKNLYKRVLAKMELPMDMPTTEFPGVKMEDLSVLEQLFGVSISVFSFQEVPVSHIYPRGIKPSVLRMSTVKKSHAPNGHLDTVRFMEHLMYITDLLKTIGDVCCSVCDKRHESHNFARHVQRCGKSIGPELRRQPKIVYQECREYTPYTGVLDELQERYNVEISKQDAYIVN